MYILLIMILLASCTVQAGENDASVKLKEQCDGKREVSAGTFIHECMPRMKQAGEIDVQPMILTPKKAYSMRDYHSKELVRCEDNKDLVMKCWTPCEKRMQEAMKGMDQFIAAYKQWTLNPDRPSYSGVMPTRALTQQWDATMKDCVP